MIQPSLEELLGAVRDELRMLIIHDATTVGSPTQRSASMELRIATARRAQLEHAMRAYLAGVR